jgi:S-DNA-T family DNA segregation ATPase FtsK/SpoIIIE
LLPDLTALVRDTRAYGIHFSISGDQTNAMPGKMFSIIAERYTLKLSDAGEYSNIVGRGVKDVDPIPGRGYVRVGRMPLEFQAALPLGVDEEDRLKGIYEAEKMNRLAARMTQAPHPGRHWYQRP